MSTVLMVGGTVLSAVGQLQQAHAASQAAAYNAQIAEMEAKAIKVSGEREAERLKREKRLMTGKQKALYAKAGVRLAGSPFEVLSDTATQYELDIQAQRYTTQIGITKAQTEAQYLRQRAGAYGIAGRIGAVSTLLTGVGRIGYGVGR